MTALAIVEALDKLEDGTLELRSRPPCFLVKQLGLKGGEEALHYGIVASTANSAHAAEDAARLKVLAKAQGGVLSTVIGMVNHASFGSAVMRRHPHGRKHQLCVGALAHGPAHHLSGVAVEHYGEVHPPLKCFVLGDIGYP